MDFLQIALLLLIIILGIILSILGLQVFYILSDLRKSLEKLDRFVSEADQFSQELNDVKKVLKTNNPDSKIKPEAEEPKKSVKRLFRRRFRI